MILYWTFFSFNIFLINLLKPYIPDYLYLINSLHSLQVLGCFWSSPSFLSLLLLFQDSLWAMIGHLSYSVINKEGVKNICL